MPAAAVHAPVHWAHRRQKAEDRGWGLTHMRASTTSTSGRACTARACPVSVGAALPGSRDPRFSVERSRLLVGGSRFSGAFFCLPAAAWHRYSTCAKCGLSPPRPAACVAPAREWGGGCSALQSTAPRRPQPEAAPRSLSRSSTLGRSGAGGPACGCCLAPSPPLRSAFICRWRVMPPFSCMRVLHEFPFALPLRRGP